MDARRKQELESELGMDSVFYKSDIYRERHRVVGEIANLATGFRFLRTTPIDQRDWRNLLDDALLASEEEAGLVRKAAPPLYIERGTPEWNVAQISGWIRRTLLAYPGILYDPVFAATELRISVEAFLSTEVQELFDGAKYAGVFASSEGRWWRERLWRIAMEYVEDTQFANKFAATFHQRNGKELAPAESIVRGEIPADTVCYIYHQPVMYKYTVAYRPDNRPPVMDPARVSFKAIQQSNQVQWALIEGVSDELLERIRNMRL